MAPLLKLSVEAAGVLAAFDRLGTDAEVVLEAEAKDTAERIASDARARVPRLSGRTAHGIHVEPSRDGLGFVVLAYDADGAGGERGPVDLYLEFGTKYMTARPFLFNAATLEEGPYLRRVADALQDAIDRVGLS